MARTERDRPWTEARGRGGRGPRDGGARTGRTGAARRTRMDADGPAPTVALESRRRTIAGGQMAADGRRRARTRGRPQTGGGACGRRANGRGRRCADTGTKALDTK